MSAKEILVVDDEIGIRELLSEILFDEGYHVSVAENAVQARDYRNRMAPDLVLLDIWMPETDGITLLKEWVDKGLLTMPVIMMSGHGTIETAVEATRIGAVDFLEKPVALRKLLDTISRAIRQGVPHTPPEAQSASSDIISRLPFTLDVPLREAREQFDSLYFNHHMLKENGNMVRVAQNAGLERTHLYRKLKQLNFKFAKKTLGEE
jgi:DNA-binding NtrC family response regulator